MRMSGGTRTLRYDPAAIPAATWVMEDDVSCGFLLISSFQVRGKLEWEGSLSALREERFRRQAG